MSTGECAKESVKETWMRENMIKTCEVPYRATHPTHRWQAWIDGAEVKDKWLWGSVRSWGETENAALFMLCNRYSIRLWPGIADEIVGLSPKEFCRDTNADSVFSEFAGQFTSMSSVWVACDSAVWLLWMLSCVAADGLPDFADWCAEMAMRGASDEKSRVLNWEAFMPQVNRVRDEATAARAAMPVHSEIFQETAAAAQSADIAINLLLPKAIRLRMGEHHVEKSQIAEIKRRWGNPFRKECDKQEVKP